MFKALRSLFNKGNQDAANAYLRGLNEGRKMAQDDQATGQKAAKNITNTDQDNRPEGRRPEPLTKKELGQASKLKNKILTELEEAINTTTAGGIQGAAIIKEAGKIKLHKMNNKTEALDLLRRAKNNEVRIIII